MAKQKSEQTRASSASRESTAKKSSAASKQPPAGKPVKPMPTGDPMIDTSLAAENAARMLAAGFSRRERHAQDDDEKKEGSLIKQLKAELNKPAAHAVSSVLDKSAGAGQKRPNLPFGRKQVGHNQTFGPDLTRSGVPRRTGG